MSDTSDTVARLISQRYATAKRFYGDELAEAALVAYAKFGESL